MKEYEKSRSRSRFAQPFLTRFCMFCAYTRPRYQVNVYSTVGSMVFQISIKGLMHLHVCVLPLPKLYLLRVRTI